MKPFFIKNYLTGEVDTIATEEDRLNYIFKNNLTIAPNLEDLEMEERRGLKRKQKILRSLIRGIASDIYNRYFWGHVWDNHFKNKERFKTNYLTPKNINQNTSKLYWNTF